MTKMVLQDILVKVFVRGNTNAQNFAQNSDYYHSCPFILMWQIYKESYKQKTFSVCKIVD